jgi:hypothetical protein
MGCLIVRNDVQVGMQSIPAMPRRHKRQRHARRNRVLLSAGFPGTTVFRDGRMTGELYVSANGNRDWRS